MLSFLDQKFELLNICKQRKSNANYREIVFFNKDIKKWNRMLSGHLGSPIQAKSGMPDQSLNKITRKFGGIRKGQTVYIKKYDNFSILAMLWPWKDQQHTTLKVSMIH